jgi:HEAT repeat protein
LRKRGLKIVRHLIFTAFFSAACCLIVSGQIFTPPNQFAIDAQVARLRSDETETRRDAVHQLRLMQNAIASRAAMAVLRDKSEVVRAVAASAAAFLPDEEAAAALVPLLAFDENKRPRFSEKSEFVRREAAFALGEARSKTSVPTLIKTLLKDSELSVRCAAAVALGKIADQRAVETLAQVLNAPKPRKEKLQTQYEFLRRSVAKSLGEIGDRRAVPILIQTLRESGNAADIRREAAFALGLIADRAAIDVLRENLNSEDDLLVEIARNALRRIESNAEETQRR